MNFDTGAAIGAGLIAGAAMSLLLYLGIAMMPRQMKMDLFLMLGTMVTGTRAVAAGAGATTEVNKPVAYLAGAMMHAAMSIAFGLAHVAVYAAFGLESALAVWGVLFGLAHWLLSGVGLAMVPSIHPLMKNGQMAAPGAFALNYPAMTAGGFFMLHVIFGVLVGALYTALAG